MAPRDRNLRNLRPLLPKHSVTVQAGDTHLTKGNCMPPQTASQIEASVAHAKGANPYTDIDPGLLSLAPKPPLSSSGSLPRRDLQSSSSALPSGEVPDGGVECGIPPNCEAHPSSGLHYDLNDWINYRRESFPGRLYNSLTGETHRPAGPNIDEPASQKLEDVDRDSPDLPSDSPASPRFFEDEMAIRDYQRSSISSKSEDLIYGRIPEIPDPAMSSDDPVAHTGPPPSARDPSALGQGLDCISSLIEKNPPVDQSTIGHSSTRSSLWDSSSLASFSQPHTSIYGSAPSVASSRARQCGECDKSFKLGKDLDRHFQSVHAHNPESYWCRCNYHTTRKDVMKRHIYPPNSIAQKCASARPDALDICICKRFKTSDAAEYVKHMKSCSSKPRGRPKKIKT
ncbi:unnamed protein product [Clonostachys rosea]|uniref:C2H2-type domain-containing protein n=1 Tax=Bionectria ochroleuca TaxID=29856 RepID=A0ABY6U9I1_BIOOC|nr:unnamed protein product [Clonostachys rosea]